MTSVCLSRVTILHSKTDLHPTRILHDSFNTVKLVSEYASCPVLRTSPYAQHISALPKSNLLLSSPISSFLSNNRHFIILHHFSPANFAFPLVPATQAPRGKRRAVRVYALQKSYVVQGVPSLPVRPEYVAKVRSVLLQGFNWESANKVCLFCHPAKIHLHLPISLS